MLTTSQEINGISRQIANNLRQRIADQQWAVGDRLPSVRQMAIDFHVSTETVRGALRELEALNLIETRPRQGGFIKALAPANPTGPETQKIHVAFVRTSDVVDAVFDRTHMNDKLDEWGVRLMLGVDSCLRDADFPMTLVSTPPNSIELTRILLEKLDRLGNSLAGVVVLFHEPLRPLVMEIRHRNIPCVTIGSENNAFSENHVSAANIFGGRMVGQCFARLGHRRVLYISPPLRQCHSSLDKLTGLMQGYLLVNQSPPQFDCAVSNDLTQNGGYQAVREYLRDHPAPQGIYTEGDFLASGAICACREAGLKVPEDVDIVGSTEMLSSSFIDPPLTTVRQPTNEMGFAAGEMVLRLISGEADWTSNKLIPTSLILRSSMKMPDHIYHALTPDAMCPLVIPAANNPSRGR